MARKTKSFVVASHSPARYPDTRPTPVNGRFPASLFGYERTAMIPGPVFNFELLTTARRGRFYAVRGAYAFVLLLIFWIIHLDWAAERGGTLTVKQVGDFALVCFFGVALGQMLLVLTLTPALVAGVIADEKQRKTLHYLLASRLSGPEIVIGKLLARMLHVGVLLAVSVPVLSMLVLLGGIDPMVILLACGAAASISLVSGGPLDLGVHDRAASARSLVRRVWTRVPLALLPFHLPGVSLGGLAARRPDLGRS